MQNASLFDERLTLNEVAQRLNVRIGTVCRWTSQGVRGRRLPSYLIGGRRFVALPDLERFLQPKDQKLQPSDPKRSRAAQERLRSYGLSIPKGKDGAA